MDLCHKCKMREATQHCNICRRNYCTTCDINIHSISSKNMHIRQSIPRNNFYPSPKNSNYIKTDYQNIYKYVTDRDGFYVYTGDIKLNYDYAKHNNQNYLFTEMEPQRNYFPNNNQFSYLSPRKYYNPFNLEKEKKSYEIDSNVRISTSPTEANNHKIYSPRQYDDQHYLDETTHSIKRTKSLTYLMTDSDNKLNFDQRMNLMNKINNLHMEFSNTKDNLTQRINTLNEHINNINESNRNKILQLNENNVQQINKIANGKNVQINYLTELVNDQEQECKKLAEKKNNLDKEINETQLITKKYEEEKNNIIDEMDKLDDFYTEKKKNLEEMFKLEKESIEKDYEDQKKMISINSKKDLTELNNQIIILGEEKKEKEKLIEEELSNLQSQIDELEEIKNIWINKNEDLIKQNNDLRYQLDNKIKSYNCEEQNANIIRGNLELNKQKNREAILQYQRSMKQNQLEHDRIYGKFFKNKK